MTLSQNSQSKPPEQDRSHCIEGRVTQNEAIIWQYFFRPCYNVISHENAQSVGKFYKCCEIKPDPQNTKPLHNPHLPSFLSWMTGDFHSWLRGQVWDLWDKADLTEWKGLTWGTWENGGEDCLMWHISNNPGCLGKESWENSELSILPIQVFQTCQGNTFQNWMLERTVPKEKWKCPNSQFNITNMVAKSYWVNSRLLYHGVKRNQSLCHCEKGVLGALTTLFSVFRPLRSSSFLTLKHINFTRKYFHLEEENTRFWYSHPED